MIREVRLKPAATISAESSSVNPSTSPYPWLGTGSKAVHEIWAANGDEANNPAEASEEWTYAWPMNYGMEHLVSFEQGPTLALFNKVTLRARFDTFQTGPNNWWYPPDNSFGPGITFVIRNRAKDAWIEGPQHWHLGEDYTGVGGPDLTNIDDFNSRPSEGDTWALTPWVEWEMTSHPEGGPFTLEDINNLGAGIRYLASVGPNGKAYDETAGSFFKIRTPNFLCVLTVQDLGGYVRSVRHNSSAILRMKRKARNTISMKLPAERAMKEAGETVHISHEQGADSAGEGWGVRALDRRSAYIAERIYWPEQLSVTDVCYDLHDFNCEAWAAFRIPIPWTPELSGLAYLDQGGEWTHARAQDAWSLREGDGVALRVLEDYPNLSLEGLAIHSALGEELALYNANLGNAAWTTATDGGASFAAEEELPTADELGYSDTVVLTFSGTPGTASKQQEFALVEGDTVSIRARVRNITNDDPATKFMQMAFVDGSGNYWNVANRSWDAAPVLNPIPATDGFGEVITDQVPIPATDTYTLSIGRLGSEINSCSFVLGLASVQKDAPGCGMPLVTLGSTITRVADVFTMDNASPYTFWHRSRGMVIVEWKPFWRALSLSESERKTIIQAVHTNEATDTLLFEAGESDALVFERYDGANTDEIRIPIMDANGNTLRLTRDYYVRSWVRWLDADGWRQFGPYEVALGYAVFTSQDVFVAYHETSAAWDAPTGGISEDEVRLAGLDGWVRWLEVKSNPLTGAEAVWRR